MPLNTVLAGIVAPCLGWCNFETLITGNHLDIELLTFKYFFYSMLGYLMKQVSVSGFVGNLTFNSFSLVFHVIVCVSDIFYFLSCCIPVFTPYFPIYHLVMGLLLCGPNINCFGAQTYILY